MLLHGFGKDRDGAGEGVRFEELPVTGKDESPLVPGPGNRFLLDLSGIADEGVYDKAQRHLAVRRSQVQEAGPTWSSSCRRA
ncbi:hypothetical protein SZN_31484 [Streptomyces zinciresistens K42]|uniref:Uncharacterized protein n=1 Tax=Streptomyces zinciresistens K42 TaxID=700597 RepID=G2GLA1_9ACTN|nr:hypothetical protein SZN_31484 [Streptomyces zinciresistens K42]